MKDNDLVYDWLDFVSLQRPNRKSLFKEQQTQEVKPQISKEQLVQQRIQRARSAVGLDISYGLGQGGTDPMSPTPSSTGKCDCSGFIAWVIGQNRTDTKRQGVKYLESTNVTNDANGSQIDFIKLPGPEVGAIATYPDSAGRQGHMALITSVSPFMGIDCNKGPSDKTGKAISEHSMDFFNKHPDTVYVAPRADGVYGEIAGTEAQQTSGRGSYDDLGMSKFYKNVFGDFGNKSLSESKLNKKIFSIIDQTEKKIYTKYQKYFDSLLRHLEAKLKLTKPVQIVLEEDEKNAKKVLGRTGGYINDKNKVHIFTTGRHIKDIMRSLSHELVHHSQNIRGEFDNHEPTKHGYAQSNKHLRNMEKEAYLKGNILFRDWEDNYKYRGDK